MRPNIGNHHDCIYQHNLNPKQMTAEERFSEIAKIIIKGIKRLKEKEAKQKLEQLLKTNNITPETLNNFVKQNNKKSEGMP